MSNKEVKSNNEVNATSAISRQVPWKKISKGIPVEAGKNWITGLTQAQRVQAMINHENYWKTKYNSMRGTVALQQNWSRG